MSPVQADDLPDGGVDLLQLRHILAAGADEPGVGGLPGHPLAAALGAHVLRVPPHGVLPAAVGEFQLHLRGGFRVGVLGAEHARLPAAAAGLAEQGKADGVKNGGLPRAGVTGDEIQTALPQLFKIQFHRSRVGAKGGDGQFQRSHASPSQIRSISSRA